MAAAKGDSGHGGEIYKRHSRDRVPGLASNHHALFSRSRLASAVHLQLALSLAPWTSGSVGIAHRRIDLRRCDSSRCWVMKDIFPARCACACLVRYTCSRTDLATQIHLQRIPWRLRPLVPILALQAHCARSPSAIGCRRLWIATHGTRYQREKTPMAGTWEDGIEDSLSAIGVLHAHRRRVLYQQRPRHSSSSPGASNLLFPLKRCFQHGESSSFGAPADAIPRAYYGAVRLCARSLQEVQ